MNRLKNIVPALVVVTLWAGLSLGCAAELPPQQDLQTAELALDQVPAPPAEEASFPPDAFAAAAAMAECISDAVARRGGRPFPRAAAAYG